MEVRAAVLMGIRKAKYKTNHKEHHTHEEKITGVSVHPKTKKSSFFSFFDLFFFFLVSIAQTFCELAHSALTVNQTRKCPANESFNKTRCQDR